jgi:hypothetical protein
MLGYKDYPLFQGQTELIELHGGMTLRALKDIASMDVSGLKCTAELVQISRNSKSLN